MRTRHAELRPEVRSAAKGATGAHAGGLRDRADLQSPAAAARDDGVGARADVRRPRADHRRRRLDRRNGRIRARDDGSRACGSWRCRTGERVSRAQRRSGRVARAVALCARLGRRVAPDEARRQMRETEAAGTRWSYTRYELMDAGGAPGALARRRLGGRLGVDPAPLLTDELGVTICAAMMERSLVDEAGGFREQFPSARISISSCGSRCARRRTRWTNRSCARASTPAARTSDTRPEEVTPRRCRVPRARGRSRRSGAAAYRATKGGRLLWRRGRGCFVGAAVAGGWVFRESRRTLRAALLSLQNASLTPRPRRASHWHTSD